MKEACKVLFVCPGNTCRSPMTMAIAMHYFRENASLADSYEFVFDCAAIKPLISETYHLRANVHPLAVAAIDRQEIRPNPIRDYVPKAVTQALIDQHDYIMFIKQSDMGAAQKRFVKDKHKLIQLHPRGRDIIDPYDGEGLNIKPDKVGELAGTLECYLRVVNQLQDLMPGLKRRLISKQKMESMPKPISIISRVNTFQAPITPFGAKSWAAIASKPS